MIVLPHLGDAQVHLCSQCEGGWYPHGVLGAVGQCTVEELQATELAISLVGEQHENVDKQADLACPVCSQTMRRFSYSLAPKVKLDECFEHGTWLDDGELGSILDAVAISSASIAEYRKGIEDMRRRMDLDGVARGGSSLNPIALTIRFLNAVFAKSKA